MAPIAALWFSGISLTAMVVLPSIQSILLFSIGSAVLLTLCAQTCRVVPLALKLSVPFTVPLLIVHGILNPSYETSTFCLGFIPLRPAGMVFGVVVTLRILVLSFLVAAWREVDRDRLIQESILAGIPLHLVVMLSVAASTSKMLPSRVSKVYLAQQARGIPAGPSVMARIMAMPKIAIPVITSTLCEANTRGTIMTNRGLGTTTMSPARRPIALSMSDKTLMFFCSLLLVVSWIIHNNTMY